MRSSSALFVLFDEHPDSFGCTIRSAIRCSLRLATRPSIESARDPLQDPNAIPLRSPFRRCIAEAWRVNEQAIIVAQHRRLHHRHTFVCSVAAVPALSVSFCLLEPCVRLYPDALAALVPIGTRRCLSFAPKCHFTEVIPLMPLFASNASTGVYLRRVMAIDSAYI